MVFRKSEGNHSPADFHEAHYNGIFAEKEEGKAKKIHEILEEPRQYALGKEA